MSLPIMNEAAYSTNSNLKKVEDEFKKLHDTVMKFYDAMKKRKLNPNSANDIYNYYYSTLPEKDKVRVTNWNEHIKKIEDLIKKIFKFRSVKIDFQVYSIYGPHTIKGNRTIMDIPVVHVSTVGNEAGTLTARWSTIESEPDIGKVDFEDGKIVTKVGYPTELKASKTGIVDKSDGIEAYIKLQMYENMTPREYVAILLHEIGHNIDAKTVNIMVKDDSMMIDAIKTNTRDSATKHLSKGISALFKIIGQKKKRPYQDVLKEIAEDMGKSTAYGGDDKRSELYADALPTAYGYGPDLVRALNKLAPDVKEKKDKESTSLFRAYKSYRQMLRIITRIDFRERDVHGSNLYRAKTIIKQMKEDLAKTKDSKIKSRLKKNIADTEKLIQDMIDSPENSEEVKKMLQVWVDSMEI